MKNIILVILLATSLAHGQSNKRDSIWSPIKYFIGSWKGEGGGEPGIGTYERTYQFILKNNFVEIRNKSTYPAVDKDSKGEVHEDLGHFIYDKGRKTFLLRQLHVESFANDYVLETISPDKSVLIFTSEAIINIPKGWRARETYKILTEKEFEETFELAEPGKDYAVYTKVKFVKVK